MRLLPSRLWDATEVTHIAYAPVLLMEKAKRIMKRCAQHPEEGELCIVRTIYQMERGELMFVFTLLFPTTI